MASSFITISVEIMHDKNLTQSQKFILAEIEQLCSLEKGCVASNEHFSNLIGLAKESISRSINDLEKKGYINIEVVNGTRNHTRIITINKTSSINKTSRPPKQNVKTPLTKHQETKENIQSNIQSNIKNKAKKDETTALPENLDIELWNDFLDLRKKLKAPNTHRALSGLIKKLFDLQSKGYDCNEIVQTAYENGWKSFYEPKQQQSGTKTQYKQYNTPTMQTLNTDVNVWDIVNEYQDINQHQEQQGVING